MSREVGERGVSGESNRNISSLRVAIVHYWFVSHGGGENVVEALGEIFPQADLYTLVARPETMPPALRQHKLYTSFLQKIPFARRFHRHFLALQPLALEQFDLNNYDLVISSESGPAKGVLTSSRTCHICYCHSPMRYIWEMQAEYLRGMNPLVGTIFRLVAHKIRLWDVASAARVDYFVANSRFIASRIRKYYRRPSTVIHPPVETASSAPSATPGSYYVTVGRLVDYKRFDLAVEVCTRLRRPLRVIGSGPQEKFLRRMAGPSVEFCGHVSDDELRRQLAGCRALLFPGEEDFGIVPVEAQSFGRPVIAYGSGGVLETVRGIPPGESVDDATGIFFHEQSPAALEAAILDFEAREAEFDPQAIHRHAASFSKERFQSEMREFITQALENFHQQYSTSVLPEEFAPAAK